jgi:hypothetical protein
MKVHYIWIGTEEIPFKYLDNFKKCTSLNPIFSFQIWKNHDCINILDEYGLSNYWLELTFICKCNLLKYLILHKFGGIYTDFDITWKISFTKILNDFNFGYNDLILTVLDNNPININNNLVDLLDDPFIVSKPNILGACINYCKNRNKLKYDGDFFIKNKQLKIHDLEPIGPFGLTEWIYFNNIKFSSFHQSMLLDKNGYFGKHEQKTIWKS